MDGSRAYRFCFLSPTSPALMSEEPDTQTGLPADSSQIIRMVERVISQLQDVRDELQAPTTVKIMRELHHRTGSSAMEGAAQVTTGIEQAIRAAQMMESATRQEFLAGREEHTVDGVDNLPAPLARFLAERSAIPGFTYKVTQDEIRGWIIQWKEYQDNGVIRGCGQF